MITRTSTRPKGVQTRYLCHALKSILGLVWPWPLASCDLDLWSRVTVTFDLMWPWPLASCDLDLWPPVTLTFGLMWPHDPKVDCFMPLSRGSVVPTSIKISSSVFNISCSQYLVTDKQTDGWTDKWMDRLKTQC